MLSLKSPIGTNYRINSNDLMDAKRALNQLGYYEVRPHRGIDDWTDDATFAGIKKFQQDNGLQVDGFMRPGGPTERAINASLADNESKPGLGEGEAPPLGSGKGGIRLPGNNMPVGIPPNMNPNMPVLTEPQVQYNGRPYWGKGGPIVEGIDPRNGGIIRPPRGAY